MFEENENPVTEEVAENVEETTEETEEAGEEVEEPTIEEPEEQEETFTKTQVDELIAKKLARKEAKIRKEYDKKYGRVESLLKAGLETDSIEDATNQLSEFYAKKGVKIPQESEYSEEDMKDLGRSDARKIIDSDYDEVVEEVERLAKLGNANMTTREREYFITLAEYRQVQDRRKELAKIGVKSDVYDSEDFKNFANQFKSETPINKVYELYAKTKNTTQTETIGSMKNLGSKEEKTYFTPDEVDRLTEKELDDPNIQKKIRESMYKW